MVLLIYWLFSCQSITEDRSYSRKKNMERSRKRAAAYTWQFRKTVLKQDCVPGITSFHSTFNLTRRITRGMVVSIYEIYRRHLSWPKRNACTHWAVNARTREVTLRTSVDQGGEQIITRDINTSRGIKAFSTREGPVH